MKRIISKTNEIDMCYIFYKCPLLKEIYILNSISKNKTKFFENYPSLIKLDLSDFIMKNINNINEIGFLCKTLTKLDLGNFNPKNSNSMNQFLFKLNK